MIWVRGATGVFKSSVQGVTRPPIKRSPGSDSLGMVGEEDLRGDRRGPGAGEVLVLAVNGIGDGETAYVDEVLLDVPTDSVLLVEEEKPSDRELMDNGLHVAGDDGDG